VFRPIATRRTFEEAVSQIADAIRDGTLHEGDRLPAERMLAQQMAISRRTLREATGVLVDAGVLEARPGGGVYVVSEVIPVELLARRSQIKANEIAAILEARRVIEPRVAQLAALYGTDEDIERMQKVIELQRLCPPDDHERFRHLDMRFHITMARATHNRKLVSVMRDLLDDLQVVTDMALRVNDDDIDRMVAIHQETLDAVIRGDEAEIENVMSMHLSVLERIWEEESGRQRLRRPPAFLVAPAVAPD
jgi:GntR family transcriptional repressor for pyruvate dehydrogenase complex